MRFSFRIFLGFFLVIGLGAYLFFATFMTELKPAFRQSTEESLVDIANLLAELVSEDVNTGNIESGRFADSVKAFHNRKLNASIWSLKKHNPGLNIYITDVNGIVVYDSTGRNTGKDYSQWNDVYLTLRGQYGVRSTQSDPDNKFSSVMHVAAPLMDGEKIIGVITVSKANANVRPLIQAAQRNLTRKGGILLFISLIAGVILSYWLSRSIRQLADYANAVKRGEPVKTPEVYGTELNELSTAMADMKAELEGKQYIEQYIQTLTHQLKTPIASIQGAAELINEDMAPSQRQRFIDNIGTETERLQQIVQHMLSLAEIENRENLESVESIDLKLLIDDVVQSQIASIENKSLMIDKQLSSEILIRGERFLLQQAISNLLDNAVSFSPENGTIKIAVDKSADCLTLNMSDEGTGIPDYAIDRLFERFYSLPRPESQLKGSGLGLCFVKEIARLHGGDIKISNIQPHGVLAALQFDVGWR